MAGSLVCLAGVLLATVLPVRRPRGPAEVPPRPAEVEVGAKAPDFLLRDLGGESFRLGERIGRTPVVVQFGSISCPLCLAKAEPLKAASHAYGRHAEFVFVYCRESHPMMSMASRGGVCTPAVPQTVSREQRAERAGQFREWLGAERRILVDEEGEASVQRLYGVQAEQVFVIDTHGVVVYKGAPGEVAEEDQARAWGEVLHDQLKLY